MKALSRDQVLAVLKAAKQASERDYCAILLSYRHALRASEVCSLNTRNFSDGYITIQRLKGSLKTVQPLFDSEEPLLDERKEITRYLATIPKGQRLFPITRQHYHRLFRAYCLQVGIPAHLAHPHSAKHAIAMELVSKVAINELQRFLGHRSLNSTGMYLRVDDEKACAAVAGVMK